MTITIAIILVVLLLMTLVLFFLVKREVNDINNKSKIYFTRKAQEYTESINREVNNNSSKEEEIKKENDDKRINEDVNKFNPTVVYVEKRANYEINDLLKMMKQIDNKFDVNNINIIKTFIKEYVKNDKSKVHRYSDLLRMKKYIDKIGVLNIITSDDYSLKDKIVHDLTLINEDIFMEFYSGKLEFEVEDFCNFLDYEMGNCDPTIYVYVGNNKANYDMIDKRIKTIYSNEIYKGIKIVYLNKMYDYSLS